LGNIGHQAEDKTMNDSDIWRTQPMYSIGEAAHLAGVSTATVRRWLQGYVPDRRRPSRKSPPVFGDRVDSPFVSFLQLAEIVVAGDFRKVGHVKLDVVRQAHANTRSESGIEYPFAHLELESLGGHIIRWIRKRDGARAQSVDSPDQWALPGLVAQRMQEFEYERDLAARWYPVGKTVPVVIDPLYSAGLPTIAGRGVTVAAIFRRWRAGQLIDFIADDLQVAPASVERTLQYAEKIAA
jgi:uncharacterized protein (DUF433 family)